MKTAQDHYVYAYFDPRNYEMFYVGEGHGSRKNAHHPNKAGTAKERQIHEIERSGLKPLIRVVAANLTKEEACLVEKALIWRTGKWLTNLSGGMYADSFRPPDTLHKRLPGFDFARSVYVVNVTAAPHRHWDDMRKLGFVAAGYGRQFSRPLDRLEIDDFVAAYLGKKSSGGSGKNGYLGIGRVTSKAVAIKDFRLNGQKLSRRGLKGKDLFHDEDDSERCEYLVRVRWIKAMKLADAARKPGLFAPRPIVTLLSDAKVLEFLQERFKVDFVKLLSGD